MATLLRPPLGFPPQQKRPIAAVDYFSRPLTLGINPNAAVQQQFDSAPPRKNQVIVEQGLNLLSSTLAPSGVTIPLPLAAEQVDDSSPRRWMFNQVDHQRPLTLGINPNAKVAQWFESSPPRELPVTADGVPNLLANTLAGTAPTLDLPLRVEMWDDGAPPRKRQTLAEQFMGRMVWLDAVPQVLRLDSSAFQAKFQVFREPTPNLTATTLNLVLVPNVVGETQAQAEADIAAAGFTAGETFAYSDTIAAGLAISQVPVGGALVPPASVISIVISLGVQPSSGVVPAGRPAKRRYYVEIDQQNFVVESESAAIELLRRARAIAERQSEASAEKATKALRKKVAVPKVRLPIPVITVSPDIEAIAAPIIADIARLYAQAAETAELRLLLMKQLEDEDDDEDFLLLL